MDREEQILLASLAASVGAELRDIDQKITSKGTIPKNKIDPREFLKGVESPPRSLIAPPSNNVVMAPAVDPTLQPLPLEQLLIDLPDDIKKRAGTVSPVQPGPLVQPETPQPDPNQLTFEFVNNDKLPETPREMFLFFKAKLDKIEEKCDIMRDEIRDIKQQLKKGPKNAKSQ